MGSTAYANSPPVVTNVTAAQRQDGSKLVDIRYNLADADGDACTVSVQASNNGGSTWTVPITALSGAVGSGITPGLNKLIIWNCATDLPGAFGSQYKIRVIADDGYNPTPPGMLLVPAGSFNMGDTFNEGSTDERPVHSVYISAFYMDRYEVTNQQYAYALNWAKDQGNLIAVTDGVVYKFNSGTSYRYCSTTSAPTGSPYYGNYSRITWNGTTFDVVEGKANHPMVLVSWYGSAAYANWRSGMEGRTPLCYDTGTWACNFTANAYRLPTEAEWERAARGGQSNFRYPWGNTISGSNANYLNSGDSFEGGSIPKTTPVGYYNGGQIPPGGDMANGYGLHDMSGNVWEWCNDWYASSYPSAPQIDPTGPPSGTHRVFRGGAWDRPAGPANDLRCANRNLDPSNQLHYVFGLRLVQSAE